MWDSDDVSITAENLTLNLYKFIGFSGEVENSTISKYEKSFKKNIVSLFLVSCKIND